MCVAAMALAGCGQRIPENDLGHHYNAHYTLEHVANYTAVAQDGYFLFYKSDGTKGLLLADDQGNGNIVSTSHYNHTFHVFSDAVPASIQKKIDMHQKNLLKTGDADFKGTYVIQLSGDEPDLNTLGFRTFEIPQTDVICNARIHYAGTVQSMKCK